MAFTLGNLGILFGLIALAIPVVIHLLQRRRHETLDWGAMQFLPESSLTQRRRWLDEILLLALRLGLIAVLVVALAQPASQSDLLAPLQSRPPRDVVFVFDGSFSMDLRLPGRESPWREAVRRAQAQLGEAAPGDRFAILIARQPPHFWLEDFSGDLDEVRGKLDAMPVARGNPDLPHALADAWRHLQTHSQAAKKEIIVLTDRQHFGWADPATLASLENVGDHWRAEVGRAASDGGVVPSLRVEKVGPALPASLANLALQPLTATHGVARLGQSISFQSTLQLSKFARPPRMKVIIDHQFPEYVALPESAGAQPTQLPLHFSHRFDWTGQHLVSLALETDPAQDVLPAVCEQHLVINAVKGLAGKESSILLVDGDDMLSDESSSFFLQRALAPREDESSGVVVVPQALLKGSAIAPETPDHARPAVVILADVPRLNSKQIEALDRFLADGGGLLILAGERVAGEKAFYNEFLYRQGKGWLPAPLGEIGSASAGVRPEPRTFQHSALAIFQSAPDDCMNEVRISHWWKVRPGARDAAAPIALLSNGDPFLLEKPYKKGRVILCTVPPDRRWKSNLPGGWEFPVLVHELVYHLAENANAAMLPAGASIRLAFTHAKPRLLTLRTPEAARELFEVKSWPWVYSNTGAVGVYQVEMAGRSAVQVTAGAAGMYLTELAGGSALYVVPPDLREANLTRCTEADWQKVRKRLPVAWHGESAPDASVSENPGAELWWILLLAVLGFLCLEVWQTRRMARMRT